MEQVHGKNKLGGRLKYITWPGLTWILGAALFDGELVEIIAVVS